MLSFVVLLLPLDNLLLPSPARAYSPFLYAKITCDLQYSVRKNIVPKRFHTMCVLLLKKTKTHPKTSCV